MNSKKLQVAQVANWFIQKSHENNDIITHLKVQKLCYLANALCLSETIFPLFEDYVYAYRYGPIITNLFERLKDYGNEPINKYIGTKIGTKLFPEKDDERIVFLNEVWERFGGLSAIELSYICNKEGTPWFDIRGKFFDDKDDDKIIMEYSLIRRQFK